VRDLEVRGTARDLPGNDHSSLLMPDEPPMLTPILSSEPGQASSSVGGASGAREGGRNYQDRPATPWSRLRWELLSLWGYFRRLEPTTPVAAYLRVMERMIDSCITAGITPCCADAFHLRLPLFDEKRSELSECASTTRCQ
jgi:hypothetical protein